MVALKLKEITLVFKGGGFAIIEVSQEDSNHVLELVEGYGMPIEVRSTECVVTTIRNSLNIGDEIHFMDQKGFASGVYEIFEIKKSDQPNVDDTLVIRNEAGNEIEIFRHEAN